MNEKRRVLVVDDDPSLASEVAETLWKLGYAVVGIVATGEGAITNAQATSPDLVLMDIKLMGDMDGREAAREIRKSHGTPVIYMTAFGDKETSKSGNFSIPEGFGYIVKPFTKEELDGEIERLIG